MRIMLTEMEMVLVKERVTKKTTGDLKKKKL